MLTPVRASLPPPAARRLHLPLDDLEVAIDGRIFAVAFRVGVFEGSARFRSKRQLNNEFGFLGVVVRVLRQAEGARRAAPVASGHVGVVAPVPTRPVVVIRFKAPRPGEPHTDKRPLRRREHYALPLGQVAERRVVNLVEGHAQLGPQGPQLRQDFSRDGMVIRFMRPSVPARQGNDGEQYGEHNRFHDTSSYWFWESPGPDAPASHGELSGYRHPLQGGPDSV